MVILISGASHAGKTLLARRMMERNRHPAISLDLLKMGLIRSGQAELTPEDDGPLTPYLREIAREIIKTAIANRQNLIVEGCYIPFGWQDDFNSDNLESCRQRGLRYHLIDSSFDVEKPRIEPLSGNEFHAAAKLFYETVHAVNARDYTSDQLDAWAPRGEQHLTRIAEKISNQQTVAFKESDILVGFGSLNDEADIDMLFVHKDRQGQGVGEAILHELEGLVKTLGKRVISVFASATARPFFKHAGYTVERENSVERNGVSLVNFFMKKQLS